MGPAPRIPGVGRMPARSRPAAAPPENHNRAAVHPAVARRTQGPLVEAHPALRLPATLAHWIPDWFPEDRDQPAHSFHAHSPAPPDRSPQNEPNQSTIAVRNTG